MRRAGEYYGLIELWTFTEPSTSIRFIGRYPLFTSSSKTAAPRDNAVATAYGPSAYPWAAGVNWNCTYNIAGMSEFLKSAIASPLAVFADTMICIPFQITLAARRIPDLYVLK